MIAIKAKDRILFIDPGDVVAVQAEGNYASLPRESDSYLLRESISTVAEKLKSSGFIRIHRSALVNSSFVAEIKPYATGKCGLRVKVGRNTRSLTVTRRAETSHKVPDWSRCFP